MQERAGDPVPPVTVVVAARNAAATLGPAVRSALASAAVAQCVVVDDASDDETPSVAIALRGEDPRIVVVHRATRGGPSVARNDGLARAEGVRVCFLDADDELAPGGVEALSAALSARGEAVAALGRFVAVDDEGGPVDVGRWADDQLHGVLRRAGRVVESDDGLVPEALVTRLVSPPPGAWLVDTRCARAIGGFDDGARRSEDLEFLVRLAFAGPVVAVDRVVLRYRRHAAQRSAASSRRRWGRGHALWVMVRAAPSRRAAADLSRGMAAYHLELWSSRRRAASPAVRAMAVRNLVAAPVVRLLGVVAPVLPRRTLPPLREVAPGAVD